MKSRGLTILLLLAVAGCGIWAVAGHRARARLSEELRVVKEERDRLRETAERKISLAAQTELDPRGPRGLDPEAEPGGGESPDRREGPGLAGPDFAEMMKDPGFQDMMRSQARAQIDMQYRDLIDLLGLDPDQESKLKTLLAERGTAQMEMGLGMLEGEKGPEEMKEMQAQVEAAQAESEAELRALLGDERYDQLDRFEKSQPERQQLQSFRGLLEESGENLEVETESQLMDLMYQERTGFQWENDFSDQKNFDPSAFTPAAVDRFLEQNRELQNRIRERASAVLPASQLEAFQRSQDQQTAMAEMGLRMALRMFGDGTGGNAAPEAPREVPSPVAPGN